MKKYRSFILFCCVLFVAIFVIEHINQRFWLNDFKVYYEAANALRNHTPIYGQAFGLSTGFYKYSPFTLVCFLPATLVSFEIASSIHFFILGICTVLSFILLAQFFNHNFFENRFASTNSLLILAFICVLNHLVRELHLGNVNMLLVFLLSACLYFDLSGKHTWSGISFSLALLIKPYLIVLVVPLFLYKKYRTLLSAAASGVLAVLLFTIIYGLNQSIEFHHQWLLAMLDHSSYLFSPHTLLSILNRAGLHFIHSEHQLYALALVLVMYGLIYFFKLTSEQNELVRTRHFITAYIILLAILPNLLITDTEHFLYAVPLLILILHELFLLKNKVISSIFILFILMYGANSSDLLGNKLSDWFETNGLLGIGNFLLIILLLVIQKKYNRLNIEHT